MENMNKQHPGINISRDNFKKAKLEELDFDARGHKIVDLETDIQDLIQLHDRMIHCLEMENAILRLQNKMAEDTNLKREKGINNNSK